MTTLPLLQRRTLQAISERSKKSLPSIAVNALLYKGLIEVAPPCRGGYMTTKKGDEVLQE